MDFILWFFLMAGYIIVLAAAGLLISAPKDPKYTYEDDEEDNFADDFNSILDEMKEANDEGTND